MSRSSKRNKAKKRHHHQKHDPNAGEEKAKPILAAGSETVCPTKDTQADVPSGPSHTTIISPRPSEGNIQPVRLSLSKASSLTPAASLPVSEVDNLESLLDGLTGADLRTGTLILQALRKSEDLSRLRHLAVTHGFVNQRIRAVVWPRLLGLRPPTEYDLKLDDLLSAHPSPGTHRWTGAAGVDVGDSPSPASASPQAHKGMSTSTGHSPQRLPGLQLAPDRTDEAGDGVRRRDRSAGTDAGGGAEQHDHDHGADAAQEGVIGHRGGDDDSGGVVGPAAASSPHRAETDSAANGCSGAVDLALAPAAAAASGGRDCAAASHGAGHKAQGGACPTSPVPAREPAVGEDRVSTSGRGDAALAGDAGAVAFAAPSPVQRPEEWPGSGHQAGASRCGSAGGGVGGARCPGGAGQALPPGPSGKGGKGERSGSAGAPASTSRQPRDRCDAAGAQPPGGPTTCAARPGAAVPSHHLTSDLDRAPRCISSSSCGGAPRSEPSSSRGCSRRGSQSLVPEPDSVGDVDQDWGRGSSSGGQGRRWASHDGEWDWRQYLHWSGLPHRDSAVVEVDVARSLWAFTRGLSDPERDARRQQLKRLLNAVVAAHGGDVFYYQGLHDVASVLLLSLPGCPPPAQPPGTSGPDCLHHGAAPPAAEAAAAAASRRESRCLHSQGADPAPRDVAAAAAASAAPAAASAATAAAHGELLAFALLRRLVTTHLRDATRPSLEPVVQLLGLVPHLVHAADPALSRHLGQVGLQPFFAISWFITWWAHELDDLAPAARLFDFFLASHPLMPLYLGAVAMRSQRAALLACEDMPELHSALTNLKLVGPRSHGGGGGGGVGRASGGGGAGRAAAAPAVPLEQLLWQAEQLWRAKPPHVLLPPRVDPRGAVSQVRQRRGAGGADAPRRAGGGSAAAGDDGGGDGEGLALSACVAHAARMEGRPALWRVPDAAPVEWPAEGSAGGGHGLGRILARANSALGGRSRTALLSTALLAGVYVAAAVAIGYATFSRAATGQH